jgi:hypothetical protein
MIVGRRFPICRVHIKGSVIEVGAISNYICSDIRLFHSTLWYIMYHIFCGPGFNILSFYNFFCNRYLVLIQWQNIPKKKKKKKMLFPYKCQEAVMRKTSSAGETP